jgi:hypothetical protein
MKKLLLFILIFFLLKDLPAQIPWAINFKNNKERAGSGLYKTPFAVDDQYSQIAGRKAQVKRENSFGKKIFLKFYGGYGLFTPGSYKVSSQILVQWRDPDPSYSGFLDSTKESRSKRGIGAGFRYGFGIGIVQNDFLNIGLDAEFLRGKKVNNDLSLPVNSLDYGSVSDAMEYNTITLTPYVIFKALARPAFFLYNKLGISFSLPFTLKTSGSKNTNVTLNYPLDNNYFNYIFYENSRETITNTENSTYNTDYKISLGLGLNLSFGINFRINDRWRAFGEIFGNYSALTPRSSGSDTYDKSITLDQIDSTNFHIEQADKFLNYSSSLTTYKKGGSLGFSTYEAQDLGVDSEGFQVNKVLSAGNSPKYTINMGVLGLNMGIIYRFH